MNQYFKYLLKLLYIIKKLNDFEPNFHHKKLEFQIIYQI